MSDIEFGGKFLGQYEVKSLLGSGGMANVYQAVDIHLDRTVAIKLLNSDVTPDPDLLARFTREAQIMATLDHGGIACVYRYGSLDERRPYLIMEYIKGKSLRKLLEEREALTWWQAVQICLKVAEAMQYAHDHGIIHRDLNPNNILIVGDVAGTTVPKVVDFGLSTIVSNYQMKLTAAGSVVGTASYMSPEQCRAQPADRRSDIYSLGCTLYECITGQKVFDADTALAMFYLHVKEAPPLLSSHARASSCPRVLESIILKCLAKDPDDRYQSMGDLRSDLELLLAGRTDELDLPERTANKNTPALAALHLRVGPWIMSMLVIFVGTLVLAFSVLPESLMRKALAQICLPLPVSARIAVCQALSQAADQIHFANGSQAATFVACANIATLNQGSLDYCRILARELNYLRANGRYQEASVLATTYLNILAQTCTRLEGKTSLLLPAAAEVDDDLAAKQLTEVKDAIVLLPGRISPDLSHSSFRIAQAMAACHKHRSGLAINELRLQLSSVDKSDYIRGVLFLSAQAAYDVKDYKLAFHYLDMLLAPNIGQRVAMYREAWKLLLDILVYGPNQLYVSNLAIAANMDYTVKQWRDDECIINLAMVYMATRHYDRTEKLLRYIDEQSGHKLGLWPLSLLAQSVFLQKKYDECRALIYPTTASLWSDPDYCRIVLLQAELDMITGAKERGYAKLEQALTKLAELRDPFARYVVTTELIDSLLSIKEYSKAEALCRAVIPWIKQNKLDLAYVQLQLAEALNAQGNHDEALSLCLASTAFAHSDYELRRNYKLLYEISARLGSKDLTAVAKRMSDTATLNY